MSRSTAGNRQSNNSPDLAVAIRAASQWGVLDVAELRACGLSDHAIATRRRRGTLHLVYRGVYSVAAPPLSVQARFLAATKATDGTLARYSCLSLWRVVDFDEVAPPQIVVATRHARKVPGIEVHRTRKPPRVLLLDGIPVTSPARALADISSVMPLKSLRRAAREALATRRATITELRGQTKRLDEALAEGFVPTRNVFEDAVHDLIRTTFEPPIAQQTLILDGIPTTPDFRWPAINLCVEADGSQYHDHVLARQDDAAKQARLEAHGERVVRVTWTQATTQPEQTLTRIQNAGAPRRVTKC
ncbi:type IV toxin-antitoxin system AbiEi family antitoxin domain-containing protein [Solirubrobacter phytolaccae]|uniref:Type IV toxin-antitoxin system AbiEi family antitoxin domain-containing protein n=1 Tax=Solirubrobacter phytolaccae TaxID=1404360 RepID=A0A9X3S9S0_9ACTN|nr:type IV toxin-antitoxin system AbiEi family antitoxin domain-containing protein [Solirubrobacter phytolaccae]MDA0179540.1 type IV toxin-antitoxin system AbiEi family antitoxin domain-containing protein [Solirubrobacter phytolaccae]